MNMKKNRAAVLGGAMLSALGLFLTGASPASAATGGHWWNDSPSKNECLAAPANSTGAVIMWSCTGENGQAWQRDYDLLDNVHFQLIDGNRDCMEIPDGQEHNPGAWATINGFCGADGGNDSWELGGDVNTPAGWYWIMNSVTGMCLSVAGGSLASGAHVIQWPCHNTPDQLWQGVGL